MSVTVVSKLDIDVLVYLAVHGPLEAEGWRPLDQRPDESGRRLWQQNWDRAGFEDEERPRIEEYAFVPMPCSITLAEGFAHLSYYTYQTAEEFGRGWYSSFAGRYVERIRAQLEANLAGVGQAPWGWTARHVRERLERGGVPALRVQGPAAAPDPLIASVESVFAERGIVLTRLDQPGLRRPGGLVFGPETVVAGWEVRVASTAQHPAADASPALQVWLFAGEEAARSTYRAYTRRHTRRSPGGYAAC